MNFLSHRHSSCPKPVLGPEPGAYVRRAPFNAVREKHKGLKLWGDSYGLDTGCLPILSFYGFFGDRV